MSAVTIKFPLTAYYIPTLNLANPYSIQRESANKPYNAPLNPYNRVERGLAMFWAVNMLPLTSNTSALSRQRPAMAHNYPRWVEDVRTKEPALLQWFTPSKA
jgi:hypothetical protein